MPSFAKRWSGCNQPLAGLFTNPLMLSIFAEAVALSCGGEEARFSVPCPGESENENLSRIAIKIDVELGEEKAVGKANANSATVIFDLPLLHILYRIRTVISG